MYQHCSEENYVLIANLILSNNKNDIIYKIIHGLVKGLMFKCVDIKLIMECMRSGCLHELIKYKYKYEKSEYYNEYIKNNINIDNILDKCNDRNISFDIIKEKNNIHDDNYCTNCISEGYITQVNYINYDCKYCLTMCCKKCAIYPNDELFFKLNKIDDMICITCQNIIKKINSHNTFDKKKFNIKGDIDIDTVLLLLYEQNNKCIICHDSLLLINYKQYCC